MRIETVVIPVSDTDRSKSFYGSLGWSLDLDLSTQGSRVIRMTPPGSDCSIGFGVGFTSADPGSAYGLMLVVADIEAARGDLRARGADISEIFHIEAGSVIHAASQGIQSPRSRPPPAKPRLVRIVRRSGWQRMGSPREHFSTS